MNLVLTSLSTVTSSCNDEVNKGGLFISSRIALYLSKDVDELTEGLVGTVADLVPAKVGNVLICWLYRIAELAGSSNP